MLRRLFFPLLPKMKNEQTCLEKECIRLKVIEAADWSFPVVPVIKKNGIFRLCVD